MPLNKNTDNRYEILNTYVNAISMDETIRRVEEIIKRGIPTQHVVINASKVNLMEKDLKLRKIVNQSGKKIPEIMKLTGLSRASVHSYLPYTKGIYNAVEISLNAERCRTYKNRQEQVRLLQEIPSEENLWQAVIAFQDYPYKNERSGLR